MDERYIYELVDPRDGRTRYVGVTKRPERRRLEQCSQGMKSQGRRNWVIELARLGLQPELRIIDGPSADWRTRERYWIQRRKDEGHALLNMTSGGESGMPPYRELIEGLREANRRQFSDSVKRQRHCAGVARWHASLTPETKAKVESNLEAGRSGKFADNAKMQEGRRRWLAEHPEEAGSLTEHFGGKTQWTGTTREERSERLRERWAKKTSEQRDTFRTTMSAAAKKRAEAHPELQKEQAAHARAVKAQQPKKPMSDVQRAQLKAALAARWAKTSPEQRSEFGRKMIAARKNNRGRAGNSEFCCDKRLLRSIAWG